MSIGKIYHIITLVLVATTGAFYLAYLTALLSAQIVIDAIILMMLVSASTFIITDGRESLQKSKASKINDKKWFLVKIIATAGLIIGFAAFMVQAFGIIDISFYALIVLIIVVIQVLSLNIVKYHIGAK